jgi:lipoprotein-releasing system ATP-binding protein
MSEPLLQLIDVKRTYVTEAGPLEVLRGVDLSLVPGEIVALVGPSGSGKSSLLHAAGLLEAPTSGEVRILGQACSGLSDRERTRLRREEIGFIYQFHNLLPDFTARENIMTPLLIGGRGRSEAERRAGALLDQVGLSARAGHRPGQLSGGEQQRIALARALAPGPRILLADEPTGNLDGENAERLFQALTSASRDAGVGALVATHNLDLAARMDRILRLADGRVVG